MRFFIFIFFTWVSCVSTWAQVIDDAVVAGETETNGNVSLSWTIGDVVSNIGSSGQTVLFQGYQAVSFNLTTGLNEPESVRLHAYPNPVVELLTVELNEWGGDLHFQVFDVTGRARSVTIENQGNKAVISFADLEAGTYSVTISKQSAAVNRLGHFRVIKQ